MYTFILIVFAAELFAATTRSRPHDCTRSPGQLPLEEGHDAVGCTHAVHIAPATHSADADGTAHAGGTAHTGGSAR